MFTKDKYSKIWQLNIIEVFHGQKSKYLYYKGIGKYEPVEKIHNPRAVVIVCDATFYGKRKDKIETLVFKDIFSKEVLLWKHVQSELGKDYKQLLQVPNKN